jgi:hypothetical protein
VEGSAVYKQWVHHSHTKTVSMTNSLQLENSLKKSAKQQIKQQTITIHHNHELHI